MAFLWVYFIKVLPTKFAAWPRSTSVAKQCDRWLWTNQRHGPLARYAKLLVAHAPGMPGTFSPPPQFSYPDMHHGTCVTHMPWCIPGALTSGFLWSRWRGKCSRHSRRMRNPQFYVSGKRPIAVIVSRRVTGLTTHLLSIEHPDWSQRAPVPLHCDVTIGTSAIKIWWCCRSFMGDLYHVYGGKFDIKMQLKCYEKFANFKGKVQRF